MKIFMLILSIILTSQIILAAENQNIELTLNLAESKNPCSAEISIIADKEIYSPGEQLSFYNNLSEAIKDFQIQYQIEDINNNIIKKPVITKNLLEKHYTPNIQKEDRILIIKNELINSICENKIFSEKAILIRGNPDAKLSEVSTKTTKNPSEKSTAPKTQKTATTKTESKTKQSVSAHTKPSYQITQIDTSETFLNQSPGINSAGTLFISGEEKAKKYAPLIFIAAIILFIMHTKTKHKNKNDIKNTRDN